MIKNYESKYDNYDIGQRLSDLKNALQIQCDQNMENDYMRGMANGLLLAWNIIREPYGVDVPFIPPAKEREIG